jgi:hypothetical protein
MICGLGLYQNTRRSLSYTPNLVNSPCPVLCMGQDGMLGSQLEQQLPQVHVSITVHYELEDARKVRLQNPRRDYLPRIAVQADSPCLDLDFSPKRASKHFTRKSRFPQSPTFPSTSPSVKEPLLPFLCALRPSLNTPAQDGWSTAPR